MEVKKRYEVITQALNTLDEILQHSLELKNSQNTDPLSKRLVRDSTIKRFEYSIDTFWKFLKLYLEKKQSVVFQPPAPREVIRVAWQTGLMIEEEYDVLFKCVADRNLIAHSYNESLADQIEMRIPKYYSTMKAIIDRINF